MVECDADILVCKATWKLVQTGMSASPFTQSRQICLSRVKRA